MLAEFVKKCRSFLKPTLVNTPKLRGKSLTMDPIFLPPVARNMVNLDRSFFQKDIALLVAKFSNPRCVGEFVKKCKSDILNIPNIKPIINIDNSKGVLLKHENNDINTYNEKLSHAAKELIEKNDIQVLPYNLHLDYSFWKSDDILQAVLPEDLLTESPTGFAQAGHIAHLNLRDEFKPYGSLIGQVILDKNPHISTVVDKLDTIDTKFRVFNMKVLAGKDDLIAEQLEGGCRFRFDFSTTFWNSRLNTEHERLIAQFKPKEVVGDVFAGVGPFAVPAAKKNALVLANDLNPESYKYLKENISINKTDDFVKAFCLDGAEFIKQSPRLLMEWHQGTKSVERQKTVKKRKLDPETNKQVTTKEVETLSVAIPKFITNYVMNLPGTAIEFLNAFIGLYSRDHEVEKFVRGDEQFELPIINVHCFQKYSAEEPEPSAEELHERVRARIVDQLKYDIPLDQMKFHLVRKVAPTKPMYCVTFRLPEEVAFKKSDY